MTLNEETCEFIGEGLGNDIRKIMDFFIATDPEIIAFCNYYYDFMGNAFHAL